MDADVHFAVTKWTAASTCKLTNVTWRDKRVSPLLHIGLKKWTPHPFFVKKWMSVRMSDGHWHPLSGCGTHFRFDRRTRLMPRNYHRFLYPLRQTLTTPSPSRRTTRLIGTRYRHCSMVATDRRTGRLYEHVNPNVILDPPEESSTERQANRNQLERIATELGSNEPETLYAMDRIDRLFSRTRTYTFVFWSCSMKLQFVVYIPQMNVHGVAQSFSTP